MAGEGFLALALLAAVAFPVALYVLVRAEHDRGAEMSRADAERVARRDTPETPSRHRGGHQDDRTAAEESREDT